MRGNIRFAFIAPIALVACVACWTGAASAHGLRVRPLVTPEDAQRAAPGRLPAQVDPRWLKAQAEREQRWRGFGDDLMRASRSRYASRRVGFTPPARRRWPERGDHLTAPRINGPGPVELARVAFIRVDFANDRGGDKSTGTGRFDLSGPDTTQPPVDRAPHNRTFYKAHFEAFKRYYEAQSFGRVEIEGDVWPREENRAYTLPDMADLGPWEFSQDIYGAAVRMFRDALFAADSQSIALGDRIPWDSYDRFVIIHAGSDLQSDVRRDSPEDIPSFTIGVADTEAVIFPDSSNRERPIDRAAFIPETGSQDGYYAAINGVIAHESGHLLFGFFDLYDIESGFPVVGFWSLMDYGNGVGSIVALPDGTELFATGLLPPSIDPWHKFRFMLLDELPVPEVEYGGIMSLRSIERHPDLFRVTLSSDEYLMIENRYLAPSDSVQLDQDSTTRVVLGPKDPDRFEYDALLPGTGLLVWHIDESVLPQESVAPCDTGRANPECGINSNPSRRGVSIIEADALADLGDPGSPYIFGAPFDPFFRSNNPTLSDSTRPNLIPHIGTKPHVRLDFLDDPDSVMTMTASRVWQLPGWPIAADLPPGGPVLLAADLDGDGVDEVCWAGGDPLFGQPYALYAARTNGEGLWGGSHFLFALDAPPLPVMAAAIETPIAATPGLAGISPRRLVAATTALDTTLAGGRVWLVEVLPGSAQAVSGWPAVLPARVTTPPVMANGLVFVGCEDGRVRALDLSGVVVATSPALTGPIRGRLAYWPRNTSNLTQPAGVGFAGRIGAGSAGGDVAVFDGLTGLAAHAGWPQRVWGAGFEPDLLWIDFGGAGHAAQDCFTGDVSLVVHHADRLWAFCVDGEALPGWGRQYPDTLVDGLGAGDPDGDGFPEVLIQTIHSQIAFVNASGHPSPGWPKPGSTERFRTDSPPLALDLDGDRRSEVVAMNASGIIAALRLDGRPPDGWPLATGLFAVGAPVAADLDRDGTLELIAPDRFGRLYGYSIPVPSIDPTVPSWPMLGGDAGRSASLLLDASATAPPATAGPLVNGSLKVYPNPARRKPVSFSYRLTEPAEVEFRILDTSGHQVASFSRRGRQADNLEVWDPGALPAGLYVARLKFMGTTSERQETVPVGLLR